jgi:hypothetical protein
MSSTIKVPKTQKNLINLQSQQNEQDFSTEETSAILVHEPVIRQEIKSYKVKKTTAAQFLNDIIYLNKLTTAEPNVHFKFGPGNMNISMHSFILVARSDWFRRCWRNRNSTNYNNNDNQAYNFNIESDFQFDIEIYLNNSVPNLLNGIFDFSINKTKNLNKSNLLLIYNSFKQFSKIKFYNNIILISFKYINYFLYRRIHIQRNM